MWRIIVSAILFFNGGLLLGGVLASDKIKELTEENKYLIKKFKKKKYLYVLINESIWCNFKEGEVIELIRDCRDGAGYFKNEEGVKDYIDFSKVRPLTNNIKKL